MLFLQIDIAWIRPIKRTTFLRNRIRPTQHSCINVSDMKFTKFWAICLFLIGVQNKAQQLDDIDYYLYNDIIIV